MKNNDKDFLREVGEKLAARRKQINMKEETLANTTGLSQPTISKIECGRNEGVKLTTIRKMMGGLKMNWNELPPPIT